MQYFQTPDRLLSMPHAQGITSYCQLQHDAVGAVVECVHFLCPIHLKTSAGRGYFGQKMYKHLLVLLINKDLAESII